MKGMRSSKYQSCFPPLPLVEPFCMPSNLSGPPMALVIDTYRRTQRRAQSSTATLLTVYTGCIHHAMNGTANPRCTGCSTTDTYLTQSSFAHLVPQNPKPILPPARRDLLSRSSTARAPASDATSSPRATSPIYSQRPYTSANPPPATSWQPATSSPEVVRGYRYYTATARRSAPAVESPAPARAYRSSACA